MKQQLSKAELLQRKIGKEPRRMRKKRHQNRNIAGIALGAVIAAGVLFCTRPWQVLALFQKEEAQHVEPGEVENATLAVGTHLIHLNGMSDELYEIAQDSARESGQLSVYYKSELADGAWFDITSASSVADISAGGTPVENRVIAELYFTYETGSDGITYDLKTNEAVCIFDIEDPYKFEDFSELEELRQQYELLRNKTQKSAAEQQNEQELLDFYQKSLIDADTVLADHTMESLQSYYEKTASEDDGSKEAVLGVMKAQDAARRAKALTTLEGYLEDLLNELGGSADDNSDVIHTQEADAQQSGGSDSALLEAAADALANVQDSLRSCESESLQEENAAASANVYYELASALIDGADAGDDAACEKAADHLMAYNNILQDIQADTDAELTVLTDSLLPEARRIYQELAASGTGEAYDAAASESDASDAVLKDALKSQKSQADAAAEELKSYVRAKAQRLSQTEAGTFLDQEIALCKEWKSGVKDDAFSDYALDSLGTYEAYLEGLKSSGKSADNSALNELLDQKEETQKKKRDALDGNNLQTAQEADAELEVINEKIDALETAMSAAGERAGNGESALQAAQSLADEAAESIRKGDLSGVAENIEALGALAGSNAQAASDGLKDIYEELSAKKYLEEDGSSEISSLMDQVQSTLSGKVAPALEEDSGQDASDAAVRELAKRQAEMMNSSKSPYIYQKYAGKTQEYVSLHAVADCLGYRYIYDNDKKQVTLSMKGQTYTFYANRTDYKNGTEELSLTQNAEAQDDLYISEADAIAIFACAAQYVPDSEYALLVVDGSEDTDAVYLYTLLNRLGI